MQTTATTREMANGEMVNWRKQKRHIKRKGNVIAFKTLFRREKATYPVARRLCNWL